MPASLNAGAHHVSDSSSRALLSACDTATYDVVVLRLLVVEAGAAQSTASRSGRIHRRSEPVRVRRDLEHSHARPALTLLLVVSEARSHHQPCPAEPWKLSRAGQSASSFPTLSAHIGPIEHQDDRFKGCGGGLCKRHPYYSAKRLISTRLTSQSHEAPYPGSRSRGAESRGPGQHRIRRGAAVVLFGAAGRNAARLCRAAPVRRGRVGGGQVPGPAAPRRRRELPHGAVIDLGSLGAVELAPDKSTVSVGVGATWGDVYEALDPHGLSVNGGRASTVVSQFQIVLADGSVVAADSKERPSLFRALKGGSNNFGIVTRITFETFRQGPVWSGTVYSLSSTAEAAIDNFVAFNSATSYDEYASVMTSFVYNQARGLPVVANLLQYTKEVTGTPAAFEGFMAVPNIYSSTSVASTLATTQATAALNSGGVRSLTYAVTLVSTKEVIQAAYEKWSTSYPAIKDVRNIIFSLVLEPLPPAIYQRHATTNTLGLADRAGALVVAELSVSWADAGDDALVSSTARALVDDIVAAAKSLGGFDPYIFANYANKDQAQDVIRSYGAESVSFLMQVRHEVDPKGIFTHLVPGGYKIPEH
uniref:Oxidoreductase n=1 Tax=Diaporthe leptostromiformis TaxID=291059 RepID=A0A8J9WH58_DIALO|nr:oxidoreductase [Diaporthe leptostromiformis]